MYYIAYLERGSGYEVKIKKVETINELNDFVITCSNYLAVKQNNDGKYIMLKKGLYKSFVIVEIILITLVGVGIYLLIKK